MGFSDMEAQPIGPLLLNMEMYHGVFTGVFIRAAVHLGALYSRLSNIQVYFDYFSDR
jgi:hypothetical protein